MKLKNTSSIILANDNQKAGKGAWSKHNYKIEIKSDVVNYIKDNIGDVQNFTNKEELIEYLNDILFSSTVTGDISGSYTCDCYVAERNLFGNIDLLGMALDGLCANTSFLYKKGAEACDVAIRLYLLGECIEEVINECIEF